MPEGPEVMSYYRYLKPRLLGKRSRINIIYLKNRPRDFELVEKDNIIDDIVIKGKTLFFKLGDVYMSITHGMTGYWSRDKVKNARLEFIIDDNEYMYFIDARCFGKVKIYKNEDLYLEEYNRLGLDVLAENFTYDKFFSKLSKRGRSEIGGVLLDQTVMCGIGNYLRCDILWYAKIHHKRRISSLSEMEFRSLFSAIRNICRYYAGLDYYLEYEPEYDGCFVYGMEWDIFGNKVHKETYRGRTIHYVEVKV